MADMNRVMLMGFVTSNIEVAYIGGDENRPACRFGLATHKKYNDPQTGETKSISTFHNICFYGKTVHFIGEYIGIGDNVFVDGEIRVRTFQKADGTMGTAFEIVGDVVDLLRKKSKEAPNVEKPPLDDPDMPY